MRRFLPLLILSLFTLHSSPLFAAKTVFVDGNPVTRTPGTQITAAFLNSVNTHRHDGQAVNGSGVLDYVIAGGTGNALTISLTPAITAHVPGMPIYIKASANNTGAATLAVNGLAPAALVKRASTPLVSGDISTGQIIGVAWDGTSYQIVSREAPPVTDVISVSGQTAAQLSPPGAVMAYAATACPSGWLAANGQAVSRTTYSDLYTAITIIWGPGDGSTTFNLPDLRGEFIRGFDSGRGIDTGRVYGTVQADDIKAHSHTVNDVGSTGLDSSLWAYGDTGNGAIEDTDLHTNTTGGSETRPRNVALLYCIKY